MTASRRDTRTGGVMEAMVLPALERGGYEYFKQVDIGERLGGDDAGDLHQAADHEEQAQAHGGRVRAVRRRTGAVAAP